MKGKEELKSAENNQSKSTKKLKLKSKYRRHFSFRLRMIFNMAIFLYVSMLLLKLFNIRNQKLLIITKIME